MKSGNVRKLDINVFRSEGKVTTYFVFRNSNVIGIPSPLVPSPTEDACPTVNSGLLFYPPQINISENITIYPSIKALVTLTELSVRNEIHLGCKENIYVHFPYFFMFLEGISILKTQICLPRNLK